MYQGNKRFFIVWNAIIFLIAIYVAISIPLALAFDTFDISSRFSNWLVGIVFFIDFVLNLRMLKLAKRNSFTQELEDNWWYRYLLLFTDFMAWIPFVFFLSLPVLAFMGLFKLARTFHILRHARHTLVKYTGIYTFIAFLFWVVIAINILACGWNALEVQNNETSFANDYINALYWTVTTLTTVGYGDITPHTNSQKLYAIFVQLLGYGVFTFLIGTVASKLLQKDPARVRFEENMEGLASLMHYKTLPTNLRMRITDFYKYMWKRRLGYDETTFLQSLPENLQTEVALCLKKDAIEKVPFFRNASEEFKRDISLLLHPVFLTPGDYVFKENDAAEEMYFVVNGTLEVRDKTEKQVLRLLSDGDYFGEIALFKKQSRSATIKANTFCDVYTLDKASFEKVILKHPDFHKQLRLTIEQRENSDKRIETKIQ